MWRIFFKEVNSFLNSLIAYMVIGVFLTSLGLIVWVFPQSNVFDYGFADMYTFFSFAPYVLMFLIPAITMRSFAEERKSGTLELLLTQPLTEFQVILGKYLSAVFLVLVAILPTLFYYFTLSTLSNPPGNIDSAGVAGSYIGLILLGSVFASIGIFSSSITENQVVAFIIGVFLCFIFYYGMSSFAAIDVWGAYSVRLESLGLMHHYLSLSRGLIDSRNIIYLLGFVGVMIFLTDLVLKIRKW